MAWNATTILNRAKEFVKTYADEDRVTIDDVRTAFEEFALESRAFRETETFNSVANQKVYTLSKVLYPTVVKYDGAEIPYGEMDGVQSYRMEPSRLILNFEPDAGKPIVVDGYSIPANINTVTLQPEQYLMDAVAYNAAAKVLTRYGDGQAVSRAQVYLAYYRNALQQIYKQQNQGNPQRGGRPIRPRAISIV